MTPGFSKSRPDQPDSRGRRRSPESLYDLLLFIISRIVDYPDSVNVTETRSDDSITFEVKVHESDVGKIIGKKGRIIKALRAVMRAAAVHEGRAVSVELVS